MSTLIKRVINVRVSERRYMGLPACKSCHIYHDKRVCALIPGDGVGSELVKSVQTVFNEMKIPVLLDELFVSKHSERSINDAIDAIQKYGLCLKTPFDNYEPAFTGPYQNLNVRIRVVLNGYASVSHIKSIPGVRTRHDDVDFYIIREQTETAHANLEHQSVKGVVECLQVATWQKSSRIAKFAFDYATKLKRNSVVCVHKADVMRLSDGLFLNCCREVSKLYPRINLASLEVDTAMKELVLNPQKFDVLVMPNLYGNIASNLGVGLIGGAGICAGATYSPECVIFEPAAHHTYAQATGKNIANPTGMLLCAVKMLHHVNLGDYARQLQSAVFSVLEEGKIRTRDVGGRASTTQFTEEVIRHMQKMDGGVELNSEQNLIN